MIKAIILRLASTDSIPIIGGSVGAVSTDIIILPTPSTIISTILLAIIGALVGYGVKLVLDKIFKHRKDKKNKPPKVEFRSL